jgi:hypothetical protein
VKERPDILAEIAPEKVIEMYAKRFDHIVNPAGAIEYLRCYSKLYYSPAEVPANITARINELEARQWPAAQ